MEVKLELSVFVLLIQVSLAVWQHVTVRKGHTLSLTCPLNNAHKTSVDWKNPEGYIMFFNANQGEALKDKRYSIIKLSETEFSISISNVTFKDGGTYTCSQYRDRTKERKVEVTVLGPPKIEVTKHDGNFVIKCTAEGNRYPPQIFWKLNNGPAILAHAQVHHRDKKYVSMDMLHLHSVEKGVTVKCLVRHPALHSKPLMDFVNIQQHLTKSRRTTTTRSPIIQPQGSTKGQTTTSSWSRHGRTTVYHVATEVDRTSSHSSIQLSTVPSNQLFSSSEPKTAPAPTGFPLNPVTSTGSPLNTSGSTTRNDNATSTTEWTSETTEEITSHNGTEGNITGNVNDPKMQIDTPGGSSLLVFLVTCLIFGLLVVVIFFAIKLRRAHIIWKRENEDSDPSDDSSKSKSSQEDKNSQGQRRRGLFNTAFTRYEIERPTAITSVVNTAAMAETEIENEEQTIPPQTPGQKSAKCDIKETEL
ncbi:cytotoxic and regulatory T-cell molecule isoform X3 [Etheostoma cragini]|uniref:cytotoxic and regulatory T-cell molecule isoform X3 n=1 Tax=Etheostoma cragini TaxID=417921 RepID=UPI00155E5F46|nr:cytotoxic and regulatory T-cell molecule isoform X3 [Etheostoma cragini]